MKNTYKDWGQISETYELIKKEALNKELSNDSEAQTRFDLLDRIIKEILQYKHGQISVEEYSDGSKQGYVDYILKCADYTIVIEAKKIGASFPNPTKSRKLKITGTILGNGEIKSAIDQVEKYAIEKNADVVIVTNGSCWCFYSKRDTLPRNELYATILFPLDSPDDAEELFNIFSCQNVEKNSLESISNSFDISVIKTLSSTFKDSDARIDRNRIADHISLALDNAINGESILNDEAKLKYCFVQTDARTKYDSSLEIYLSDKKPTVILPAKRIKKDRKDDELKRTIDIIEANTHQPVTLLIGGVGSGKSTYLSHFQKIHAKKLLQEKKCFWVYIDFEKLGNEDPKKFIYTSLRDYSLKENEYIKTDYDNLVGPAYQQVFEDLARGPFSIISKNKEKYEEKKQALIEKDYDDLYPYVENIYGFLSKHNLCIIVLDNIDLYENDTLEISVLSEGIAMSKKINSNIFISIRDTTFVKHKNDSIFNAYELRKFWIDPPPLREVLSKRLKFAGEILKDKKAEITLANGFKLQIQDLSIFFDIAHSSLLQEGSARFIECISDGNIRKGIALITNFLISGHIQIEKQIENYVLKSKYNYIPFHEIFKGCVLGLWKYYIEEKAELINILSSGLNSKNLQFLRAYVLKYLKYRANDKSTLETSIVLLIETFSEIGANENHILKVVEDLLNSKLIGTNGEIAVNISTTVHITLSGAYYYDFLIKKMEYVEAVLFDTPIFIEEYWSNIHSLSVAVNYEHNILKRMTLRQKRLDCFLEYIAKCENESMNSSKIQSLAIYQEISKSIYSQFTDIFNRLKFHATRS